MKITRLIALLMAFSLSCPIVFSANTAPGPLKSLMPGPGATAGVDLANECMLDSVLPLANGGSGAGSFTKNGVIIGNGAAAFQVTAVGTNGQMLLGQTGAAPTWNTMSGDATLSAAGALTLATVTVPKGGTGVATLTSNGVLIGNGTSAITVTAEGATGIPLVGITGADPAFGTASVAGGGTGATTLTDGGIMLGSGTGAVTVTAQPTDGQLLIGKTAADPVLATLTGTANQVVVTGGAGTITLSAPQDLAAASSPTFAALTLTAPLTVPNGGSGAATFTDGGILLGSGVGAFTVTGQPTNGQLLIGSTGVDPVLATLTGTADQVVVTGGAGSITLSTPQSINTTSSPTFAALTLTAALTVPNGGSGAATFTDHGVLVGSGASAFDALAVGTNGQVLVGSTGVDPVFATIGSTGATITSTLGAGTLNMDVATDLMVHKTVAISSANILAMNGAPVELIAAPAAGKNLVIHKVMFTMDTTATQYANGGVVVFQLGNTAAGAGTETTAQIAAAVVNAAGPATSYTTVIPVSYTGLAATGLFISNETAAFATGTGTATVDIWYSVQ